MSIKLITSKRFSRGSKLLISLNNALEDLEKIDIKIIKSHLKTEPSKRKNIQKRKEVSKNNKQSSQDKSFNIPEDGGKEGQSKIEKEFE